MAQGAIAAFGDNYMSVRNIAANGETFDVLPGVSAAVAVVTKGFVRQAGREWRDLSCKVSQFGDGDFQSGSAVAGNLVLVPALEVPKSTVTVTIDEM